MKKIKTFLEILFYFEFDRIWAMRLKNFYTLKLVKKEQLENYLHTGKITLKEYLSIIG